MKHRSIAQVMNELETTWYPHRLLAYTVKVSKDPVFIRALADAVAAKAEDKKYRVYLETIVENAPMQIRESLSRLATSKLKFS